MHSINCLNIKETNDGASIDKKVNILDDVFSMSLGSNEQATAEISENISKTNRIDNVVIGEVVTCSDSGTVKVDYPGNPSNKPLRAASLCTISARDIGVEVALMFEAGNPQRPIIMGRLQRAPSQLKENFSETVDIQLDGKRLTFTAEKEIVLRCGKSSITLTRAGKVLIRGAYLLSRSTGTNRIKGGSVQIN